MKKFAVGTTVLYRTASTFPGRGWRIGRICDYGIGTLYDIEDLWGVYVDSCHQLKGPYVSWEIEKHTDLAALLYGVN